MALPEGIKEAIIPFARGIALNPIIASILTAFVSLLAGFILGKIVGKLVLAGLMAIKLDAGLERMGLRLSAERALSSLVRILIYATAVIVALDQLSATRLVVNGLIALLVLIGLVSGFLALRDLLPNLAGGIVVLSQAKIHPGKTITIKRLTGTVQSVRLLNVSLRLADQDLVIVPAATFLTTPYTIHEHRARKTSGR